MSKTKPDHYNTPISPIEYIMANGLDFCEGNVVKYVSRWKDKGGIADLEKAIEYLQFLLDEEEYNEAELFSYEQEQEREGSSTDFSRLFDDWNEERGILGQDDSSLTPKPASITPAHDACREALAERWRGYYPNVEKKFPEPVSLEEAIAKRMKNADPETKGYYDDLMEIRRREADRRRLPLMGSGGGDEDSEC
jgi:hypothetical protein